MTEQEAIAKIHSVYPTGKKNGIENMRAMMGKLGNVQDKLVMVHVAGTNGKGSCCAMIERILREAGYKTGLYTSPYIERYNERIRIDGVPVSGERLAELVERVWPAFEACDAEGTHITEFELGTAMAFVCFAMEKVDVAVIEVGLGGRIDPTNIITPRVSVITEVGMDHMQYLGDTIDQIALEKAGIIKPGVPVALGPQEKSARAVLMAAARGKGVQVFDPDAQNVRETPDGVTFDVPLPGEMMKNLTVSLRGRHQAENACAALGAICALRQSGMQIPSDAIRRGMANVYWPGRLERFGNVLLDGAHNDPGVRALCAYCDKWLPREKTVLLTGMMRDKETDRMAERLAQRVRFAVCTAPKMERALPPKELERAFERQGIGAADADTIAGALAKARHIAGEDGTVLAAGSLYMIGELRTILRSEKEFAHVI